MIVYKIDKESADKANARLRDMAGVIAEVSPSLLVLRKVLAQHDASIETPAITQFRSELIDTVTQAIGLTYTISENAQKLTKTSEQASKHLAAIDEHFGSVLRDSSKSTNK